MDSDQIQTKKIAKGLFVKKDLISDVKDDVPRRKYIEAKDTDRYKIKKIRYLEYGTERSPGMLTRPTFPELYNHPKIMFNVLGELKGVLDDGFNLVHNHSLIACVLWKDLNGVDNKSIRSSIKKFSRYDRKTMEKLSSKMNLKYLLAVMNSKTASDLLTNIRGGDYHIYPEYIRNIAIPNASDFEQQEIAKLVDEIIFAQNNDDIDKVRYISKKIDYRISSLYEKSSI